MLFKDHSDYEGRHSFLSASQSSWLRYDNEKMAMVFRNRMAAAEGSETHVFAALCINRKQKLLANGKTLNRYVNDAIGFDMETEKVLYYSDNAFVTTDAIAFRAKKGKRPVLRIHDLKTGVIPAKVEQLEVYVAYFCLEYNFKPNELDIFLRIYQNDEYVEYIPDMDDIFHIMDKIVTFDRLIEELKAGTFDE